MNTDQHLSDGTEPAHEDDAVAHLFAAARESVRPADADDLSWQRIVHRSGQRRGLRERMRSNGTSYSTLAVVASVLVAAFAIWTWAQRPFATTDVRPGSAVGATARDAISSAPTPAPLGVSTLQRPGPVPADITTWSMSYGGTSGLYALGGADCAGETCPVLLRSADDGASWKQVHSFAGTDSSGATGSSVDQIQPARAITQVRMVNTQVGYVFGGALWRTTDRGASFNELNHPGDVVIDVEIWNRNIIMLSADDCVQGRCTGPLYVSRFAVDSTSAVGQTVQVPSDGDVVNGNIVVTSDGAYLETVDSQGAHKIGYFDGSHVTDLPAPTVCKGTTLSNLELAATVAHKTVIYALCQPHLSGSTRSYSVVRSTDSGETWTVRSTDLSLPNIGQVSLTASTESTVVVSAGGPRVTSGPAASSAAGSLMVSQDGGATFTPVTKAGDTQVPAGGFDWVASPGSTEFYAVSRTQPGYWYSGNNGRTWEVVDPRS